MVPVLLGQLGLFMGRLTPSPEARSISDSTSQEAPTQDVTKLLAGGGAPTPTPTQQEPLISGIDPPPHHRGNP